MNLLLPLLGTKAKSNAVKALLGLIQQEGKDKEMIVWSLILTSAGLNLVQEVMSVEPKIISYLLLTRHCSVD